MEYIERFYREDFNSDDLIHFQVSVKETDLDIAVCRESYNRRLVKTASDVVTELRTVLESYIESDPVFKSSLVPYSVKDSAPLIAVRMAQAAQLANVGPMAAVAGAFSECVGEKLLDYSPEIIVENGGDLFIKTSRKRNVGIFAGQSPFTGRIAVEVTPEFGRIGLCTSSGTVGPSLSFGKADAAVILAETGALADAAATAVGNIILKPEDVENGVNYAAQIPGVLGAIAIKEDKMAVWGRIRIIPIKGKGTHLNKLSS